MLIKHLQSGNSYGIQLKEQHAKFPQPELGPWVERLEDRRHRLEARRARGLGATAPLSMGNEAELKGIVGSPLDDALGFSFIGIEDGEVVCRLVPTQAALGTIEPPTLHGGALATCVDTASWYAVVHASGSQAVGRNRSTLRLLAPGTPRSDADHRDLPAGGQNARRRRRARDRVGRA